MHAVNNVIFTYINSMSENTYGVAFTEAQWDLIIEALKWKIAAAKSIGLVVYVEDEKMVMQRIQEGLAHFGLRTLKSCKDCGEIGHDHCVMRKK
jgi:uncharacterized ion transporter superfamily protein YfcC